MDKHPSEKLNEKIEDIEQYNLIVEAEERERTALDKTVFTLSAGTLSISTSLFKLFQYESVYKVLLRASWVILGLSVLTFILAYVFSIKHFSNLQEKWRDNNLRFSDMHLKTEIQMYISLLNNMTLLFSFVGLALFWAFAYLNL